MVLRRLVGLRPERVPRPAAPDDAAETATVRRIVAELDALPSEQRRYIAGFAYILSRAAHADLNVTDAETKLMEEIVVRIGGLPRAPAVLVVEIAKHQSSMYGATEDYLVTREFAANSTEEQRIHAVEACFAVVAADHVITAEEYAELTQIASELGLNRAQLNVIRREYREHLTAIQRMRAETGEGGSG